MAASNFGNTSEQVRLDSNFALVSCSSPRSCNGCRCNGRRCNVGHPERIRMLLCYLARFEWDVWVISDCYNKLTSDPCSGLECYVLALANRKAVRPDEREDLNSC